MKIKNIVNKTLLVSALLTFLLFNAGCSGEKVSADSSKSNSTSTQEQNNTAADAKINNNTNTDAKEKSADLSKFNLKEAKVSRVVDGDTLELSDGSKVRLIGVNTPESTTRTEPYGKEASNYTKNQLTGKTVYLEKDVSETDQYGRLLRYIWLSVPKEINDSEIKTKMFNAVLVENGYAEVSTYPPDVKYRDYFTKYNAEARNAKKGLWSIDPNGTTKGDTSSSGTSTKSSSSSSTSSTSPNANNSTSPKGSIKGNINSKGEKIYHVPGGQYYDKTNAEQLFNTEAEAQAAGYRKSKR
ncbi:thermonuclease family protein [Clostridium arbusti]|uniref:thermonuclease family protein n=1 Tax=Clostridium arbusti TaxID=1137848 RepID=UPI000287E731|nr:thermonuclease family protein [Clostridium arbusti]